MAIPGNPVRIGALESTLSSPPTTQKTDRNEPATNNGHQTTTRSLCIESLEASFMLPLTGCTKNTAKCLTASVGGACAVLGGPLWARGRQALRL